jgi:hypothetical protein
MQHLRATNKKDKMEHLKHAFKTIAKTLMQHLDKTLAIHV